MNDGVNKKKVTPDIRWSPINPHFFVSDEESDEDQIQEPYLQKTYTTYPKEEIVFDDSDLAWDHTPEQYQLEVNLEEDQYLESLCTPQPLFQDSDTQESASSHEDVFLANTPPPEKRNLKLQRRNAIRRKNHATEPRITRRSLRLDQGTMSAPTTPSEVNLDERQNLEAVLRPRHPIINDVVNLQQVQNLQDVLESPTRPRRSQRNRHRIDYYQLHNGTLEEDSRRRKRTR